MYDNVLIGVKGDPDDHRAIALAHRLAGPGARLTLVHVSSVWAQQESEREALLGLPIRSPADLTSAFADQLGLAGGRARLIRQYSTSVGAGLQVLAARVNSDLLVLGSTRHRGLERVLKGDDVESVITGARCALAVADDGPTTGRQPPATIGVAYDGTPEGTAAVHHAQALATSLGAQLRVVYIAAPHIYAAGFGMVAYPMEEPASVVSAARAELGTVSGEQVEIIYGEPAWELEQFSELVDVLVCGSRRQGPVRRFVFGSMSLSLSHNARCPLIIAAPPAPPDSIRPVETFCAQAAPTGP